MFLNGSSVEQSIQRFELLAKTIFQKRQFFGSKLLTRLFPCLLQYSWLHQGLELLVSCIHDGLYPKNHIESVLKKVFSTNRSILDTSQATSFGTIVGLPVATTDDSPTCRIFTNHNGSEGLARNGKL